MFENRIQKWIVIIGICLLFILFFIAIEGKAQDFTIGYETYGSSYSTLSSANTYKQNDSTPATGQFYIASPGDYIDSVFAILNQSSDSIQLGLYEFIGGTSGWNLIDTTGWQVSSTSPDTVAFSVMWVLSVGKEYSLGVRGNNTQLRSTATPYAAYSIGSAWPDPWTSTSLVNAYLSIYGHGYNDLDSVSAFGYNDTTATTTSTSISSAVERCVEQIASTLCDNASLDSTAIYWDYLATTGAYSLALRADSSSVNQPSHLIAVGNAADSIASGAINNQWQVYSGFTMSSLIQASDTCWLCIRHNGLGSPTWFREDAATGWDYTFSTPISASSDPANFPTDYAYAGKTADKRYPIVNYYTNATASGLPYRRRRSMSINIPLDELLNIQGGYDKYNDELWAGGIIEVRI